jgi:hypothetical protein
MSLPLESSGLLGFLKQEKHCLLGWAQQLKSFIAERSLTPAMDSETYSTTVVILALAFGSNRRLYFWFVHLVRRLSREDHLSSDG